MVCFMVVRVVVVVVVMIVCFDEHHGCAAPLEEAPGRFVRRHCVGHLEPECIAVVFDSLAHALGQEYRNWSADRNVGVSHASSVLRRRFGPHIPTPPDRRQRDGIIRVYV